MEARTIDHGGIGWAVNHMRHGHRMRRRIWRDKTIWVGYLESSTLDLGAAMKARPFLIMRNADDTIGPYSANQADLLAADWEIFDDPHKAAA